MKRLLCLLCTALFLLPSLFSCANKPTVPLLKRTEVGLFDTVCTFSSFGDAAAFEAAADALFAELTLLDLLFDCYLQDENASNLAAVNASAGLAPVKVDERLIDFFLYVDSLPADLLEVVHPVMGALTLLWKEAEKTGIPPSKEALDQSADHIKYSALVVDEKEGTLFLTDPAARLDVGAFAKGYAARVSRDLLAERGMESYLLDLGGMLLAVGNDPRTGKPPLLGIDHPLKENEPLCRFYATDCALSTTAGDKRNFVYEGVLYHHIIDPSTLHPADSGIASVTVCSDDPALADALSTALFILPEEQRHTLLEDAAKRGSCSALLFTKEGALLPSDGFPREQDRSDGGLSTALILLLILGLLCLLLILHKKKAVLAAFMRRHPLFFSKRNLIFLSLVPTVCLLLLLVPRLIKDDDTVHAVVRHQGQVVKTLPLTEDGSYTFSCPEGKNLIVVENGRVFVSSADCPGKECVMSAPLDKDDSLGVIACLPHGLTVTIEKEEKTP